MLSLAMAANAPLWLKLVLRLERAVGGPVESAVRSDAYFDVVAELNRGTRAADRRGRERLQARSGTCSTSRPGTDIRRMREQLARMDRRLVQLSKELEELERAREAERADRGACSSAPPTCSRASTATSSARSCARATACATCAGRSRPKLGATPKDVVWQRDKAQLWRYRGGAGRATRSRC